MKTPQTLVSVLLPLLLTALILGGCRGGNKQAGPPASGPPEVEVVTLATQSVSVTTELPGRTTAYRIAEVRPQVSGIILKRHFEEGSEVKAGQLLYKIDPAVYQAVYDSARAALARAEASESSARFKAARYRKLVDRKAVSDQDQVETEAAWKQAVAEIAAAKAAVDSARINLAYTDVKASIPGRIGRSAVTEGALVTAQQAHALATIQQLDPMYIDVSQSSMALLRLKREVESGQLQVDADGKARVNVLLEDGSKYAHPGTFEFADVTVTASTGTVTLRVRVANPDSVLLPGMFVRAQLERGQRPDAILAPQVAVSRDIKGIAQAMVVTKESVVELRRLVTGQMIDEDIVVESGLQAGDRVIVAGLQKVRPGVTVKAVEAGTATAPSGNDRPATQDKAE
ncbi:MAG: efflux RND transporter periplasmic adaptor subunit [Desulfobulbus sp.]|jgi:membrane fusion protein (multidrug efflux system)|nr:efflux RND transporter periplasmic adaptor subunit [Desulfobulbus sp.]